MSTTSGYAPPKNPWYARAKKFLIVVATAVVQIAADGLWQDAPTWFYPLATATGALLTYLVPNAPKYKNPSMSH